MELLGLLDHKVLLDLVYQVNLGVLGNLERRDLEGHLALKVDMDYLDHQVCKDQDKSSLKQEKRKIE